MDARKKESAILCQAPQSTRSEEEEGEEQEREPEGTEDETRLEEKLRTWA